MSAAALTQRPRRMMTAPMSGALLSLWQQ